jgi:hypothetical protein
MPSGHDPMDDDSKKSHPALDDQPERIGAVLIGVQYLENRPTIGVTKGM